MVFAALFVGTVVLAAGWQLAFWLSDRREARRFEAQGRKRVGL